MEIQRYATYRDQVFHTTLYFNKPEKAAYVGEWSTEWREMLELLSTELQAMIAAGVGILNVNIVKTEPDMGILFAVYLTYWMHP